MGRGGKKAPTKLAESPNIGKSRGLEEIFSDMNNADPNEPDFRLPNDLRRIEGEQYSRDALFYYLENIPGIGTRLAEAIIEQLDLKTLSQIDKNPKILYEINLPGIGPKQLKDIAEKWPTWREENEAFEIDPAVAMSLMDLNYGGDFRVYKKWHEGSRDNVLSPERTCPGMAEAGEFLSGVIDDGGKIAVFCDYDVDGQSAGEVLHLGLDHYGASFQFGYADPKTGFGLTEEFVREAAREGCSVLVTLDCGSSQAKEIALAHELKMTTIVVDHHNINPANNPDFHLNPKLQDPPSSDNTGSQLSWKLAASVQYYREGKIREDHWKTPMHLAGMGTLADMGSVVLPENRAFFWHPKSYPAVGVRVLAEMLEEDPETPGHMIQTQACLNLPKRTADVSAEEVSLLFRAQSEEEAKPLAKKLVKKYKEAREAKNEMIHEALGDIGIADWNEDGSVSRPQQDKFISSYTFSKTEYIGHTGPIADKISKSTDKPAIVFAERGEDADGNKIYKFSSRNSSSAKRHKLGELLQNEAMREACMIAGQSEDGKVTYEPSLGGHPQVVSGACTKENIPRVLEVMEKWALSKGPNGDRFFPEARNRADGYPAERNVDPSRLPAIEEQAARMGPFSFTPQLAEERKRGKDEKLASNYEITITTRAKLINTAPDPEDPSWITGELEFSDGLIRQARFPADDVPPKEEVEWLIRIGRSGPYYLRKFARTRAPKS